MNDRDFIFWLNGYFELSGAEELNKDQVKIIKDHIKLVLTKVTPTVTIGSQWYPASVAGTDLILTTGSCNPNNHINEYFNQNYCSNIDGKLDVKSTETYNQKFDDMIDTAIKTHSTCETKNEQPQTNKLVMSDADHFLQTHFVRNR